MEGTTRAPAVAGTFYPASPVELGELVDGLLAAAPKGPHPKALIVPHAGYVYSGAIAATAFARVAPGIERVVVVGPAHRVFVDGLAATGAARLRTPLGDVEIEQVPGVPENPEAHAREHSIEVVVPFVQRVAPAAKLVALAGSRAAPAEVGGVLEATWGGDETLVVISSDLSHYLPYADARAVDIDTARRIVALDDVADDAACGALGINGLVWVARRKRLRIELLDLRSSGDTAGPRDEVVGYGAFAVYA